EPPHTSAALNECQGNSRQATCGSSAQDQSKADRSNCRRARDADADQKDQRTDRSRAACDWMARTRRGKIRKKAYPASRADRPSSPKSPGCQSSRESHRRADREPFFNEICQDRTRQGIHHRAVWLKLELANSFDQNAVQPGFPRCLPNWPEDRRFLNWLEAQIRGTAGYRLSRHPEWRWRV